MSRHAIAILFAILLAVLVVPQAAAAQGNPVISSVVAEDRGGFAGWTTTFDSGASVHVRRSIYVKAAPTVGGVQRYTKNQTCFVVCWTSSTSFTDVAGNSYTGY